jgi:hypothetical protein
MEGSWKDGRMEEEKGGRGELHVYRKHHHLNSLPQRGYMFIEGLHVYLHDDITNFDFQISLGGNNE